MNTIDTNTYVTQVRTQATNTILTIQKLQALKDKWDALDLTTNLDQADIGGDNDGILIADLSAVVNTTLGALDVLMAAGNATNLHKIALV